MIINKITLFVVEIYNAVDAKVNNQDSIKVSIFSTNEQESMLIKPWVP